MNASSVAPLLFNWGAPRRRNLAITGFLVASFFAHVAGFYLCQIVYPPTVSLTPAPQRVNLISANSDEGATLLRWLDAEDPALASTTRRPSDAKRYLLGKIQHVPSYFASEPALQPVPPLNVDLRVPSAQPTGPVRLAARAPATLLEPIPTRVTFSRELIRLANQNLSRPIFALPVMRPRRTHNSGLQSIRRAWFDIVFRYRRRGMSRSTSKSASISCSAVFLQDRHRALIRSLG